MGDVIVCALYRFVRLDDCADLRQPLLKTLQRNGLRGTLLLAREGLNGTVAGPREGVDALLRVLGRDPRFAGIDVKESVTDQQPFMRTKVKLKREIVTMGQPDIDPQRDAGAYVEPRDWNALIASPDVLVVDTRNDYEVAVGSFDGAVNPETANFRDFPAWAEANLDPERHTKIAMFCTGGIRCEKSTAYLKSKGFDEVYHLKGGILNYLADVPETESRWRGECFVFDERVTVDHQLRPGSYTQCNACRMPLSEADRASPDHVQGVSCPHCRASRSEADRARFAERERQLALAHARGEAHLGDAARASIDANRAHKRAQREARD
ncbi:MAG: rhodanese-related sulfurtransferase [Pseudomonadota bacterium]